MKQQLKKLKTYYKGLPLILATMFAAFLIATNYLRYATPIYRSSAKIMLASTQEGVPNNNLYKDFDIFTAKYKIATELEIFKSPVILDSVLSHIDIAVSIYRIGQLVQSDLYDESPIKVQFIESNNKDLNKFFKLKVRSTKEYILTHPNGETVNGQFNDTTQCGKNRIYITLNDSLISAKPNIQLIDNYSIKHWSRDYLIKHLKENLSVKSADKEVPVIIVSFNSANPHKAADVANQIVNTYVKDNLNVKRNAFNVTARFLDKQIANIQDKLTLAENKLQAYRDENGITNIVQETETDLRKIAQLKIQETNIKMNLDAIIELENYIQNGSSNFLELATNFEAFNDLLSTELIKNIKTLQAEKNDLLLVYMPQHEKVQVIDKKIQDQTSYLAESVTNTRKNLSAKLKRLQGDIGANSQKLKPIPEKDKKLNSLQRTFSLYQESFKFLNEKKIEAEIAKSANITFHRVIEKASIPEKPVSPNHPVVIGVSLILALFIALVILFLFKMFNGKVEDSTQIEELSSIPIVSKTPKLFSEADIKDHFEKKVIELEIKGFLDRPLIFSVSAFSKKEGSVFNTIHFAYALAKQKNKVLVISHNSSVLKNYSLPKNIAVTTIPELSSKKMRHQELSEKITQLKKQYDFIILLNTEIESKESLQFLSMAELNIICLDSCITNISKLEDIELMIEEYQLSNINYLINRNNYTPSYIKDLNTLKNWFANIKFKGFKTIKS